MCGAHVNMQRSTSYGSPFAFALMVLFIFKEQPLQNCVGCTVLLSLSTYIPNVSCKPSLFSMPEYAVARVFARCSPKPHTLQCLASW